MDINRRSFLRGFVAVTAVATIAPAALADLGLPRIVGDGIHDDTLGLQAALDRKPFTCAANLVRVDEGGILISRGLFRVSDTLHVRQSHTFITDSTFIYRNLGVKPGFQIHEEVQSSVLSGIHLHQQSGTL